MEHKGEVWSTSATLPGVVVGCVSTIFPARALGWDTAVLRLRGCFLDVVLYSLYSFADVVWHVFCTGLVPSYALIGLQLGAS